jgi:hypothetical protein
MNEKQTSHNTQRAADEKAAIKSKAKQLLKMCQEREAKRVADPNLTAEIVRKDNKTEVIKWRRLDKLNSEIL